MEWLRAVGALRGDVEGRAGIWNWRHTLLATVGVRRARRERPRGQIEAMLVGEGAEVKPE